MKKPRLSFWEIWNMSFGFLGIQFGWALQMANMSAIYDYLGASAHEIPLLWLAAPLTGLIVQPIIGYMSDRTWTRLGRRRPYFLVGAIASSIALILMPNSGALWMAAGLLWILDSSINISMEPFRAFVADKLPEEQRTQGFAMQSLFIGLGSVIASALPFVLTNWFGLESDPCEKDAIPLSIKLAFYIGSAAFFGSVLYTILTTKEYPPEDMEAFEREKKEGGGLFSGAGEIFSSIRQMPSTMKQLAWVQVCTWLGLFCMWMFFTPSTPRNVFEYQDPTEQEAIALAGLNSMLDCEDAESKPDFVAFAANPQAFVDSAAYAKLDTLGGKSAVENLAMVATSADEYQQFYATASANKKRLDEGNEWAGLCYSFQNLITFIFSFLLMKFGANIPRQRIHFGSLMVGGISLASMYFINDPYILMAAMGGVGIAWASILSMPYAMLSTSLPENKVGIYMGIFNFFIVLPEIGAALGFGWFMENVLHNNYIVAVVLGGAFMVLAAFLTLRVKEARG